MLFQLLYLSIREKHLKKIGFNEFKAPVSFCFERPAVPLQLDKKVIIVNLSNIEDLEKRLKMALLNSRTFSAIDPKLALVKTFGMFSSMPSLFAIKSVYFTVNLNLYSLLAEAMTEFALDTMSFSIASSTAASPSATIFSTCAGPAPIRVVIDWQIL